MRSADPATFINPNSGWFCKNLAELTPDNKEESSAIRQRSVSDTGLDSEVAIDSSGDPRPLLAPSCPDQVFAPPGSDVCDDC